MNDLKIIVDPTEELIDKDLEKADLIVIIHTKRKTICIDELINITELTPEYQVVYIHYYSKDNKYTLGVKKLNFKSIDL